MMQMPDGWVTPRKRVDNGALVRDGAPPARRLAAPAGRRALGSRTGPRARRTAHGDPTAWRRRRLRRAGGLSSPAGAGAVRRRPGAHARPARTVRRPPPPRSRSVPGERRGVRRVRRTVRGAALSRPNGRRAPGGEDRTEPDRLPPARGSGYRHSMPGRSPSPTGSAGTSAAPSVPAQRSRQAARSTTRPSLA